MKANISPDPDKIPFWQSFYRSQFASLTATSADFFITIFFTEVFKIWYVASNACGAFTGAIISFTLGRNWAFKRTDSRWHWQAFRYGLTSFSSINLNTGGVWFLTETFDLPYVVSKIIAGIVVGIFFNFLMYRYFVFR